MWPTLALYIWVPSQAIGRSIIAQATQLFQNGTKDYIYFWNQAMKPVNKPSSKTSQRNKLKGITISMQDNEKVPWLEQCSAQWNACVHKVTHYCLTLLHEIVSWCTTVGAKSIVDAHWPLHLLYCIACIQESKSHTYICLDTPQN